MQEDFPSRHLPTCRVDFVVDDYTRIEMGEQLPEPIYFYIHTQYDINIYLS